MFWFRNIFLLEMCFYVKHGRPNFVHVNLYFLNFCWSDDEITRTLSHNYFFYVPLKINNSQWQNLGSNIWIGSSFECGYLGFHYEFQKFLFNQSYMGNHSEYEELLISSLNQIPDQELVPGGWYRAGKNYRYLILSWHTDN